jgi:hypothetical protein
MITIGSTRMASVSPGHEAAPGEFAGPVRSSQQDLDEDRQAQQAVDDRRDAGEVADVQTC